MATAVKRRLVMPPASVTVPVMVTSVLMITGSGLASVLEVTGGAVSIFTVTETGPAGKAGAVGRSAGQGCAGRGRVKRSRIAARAGADSGLGICDTPGHGHRRGVNSIRPRWVEERYSP